MKKERRKQEIEKEERRKQERDNEERKKKARQRQRQQKEESKREIKKKERRKQEIKRDRQRSQSSPSNTVKRERKKCYFGYVISDGYRLYYFFILINFQHVTNVNLRQQFPSLCKDSVCHRAVVVKRSISWQSSHAQG